MAENEKMFKNFKFAPNELIKLPESLPLADKKNIETFSSSSTSIINLHLITND